MMKAALFVRSLILAGFVSAPALGTNVVVSSLGSSGSEITLTSANGAPLSAGSFVRLGTFPGLNPEDVAELAAQGSGALLAPMVSFGGDFPIGTGAGGGAGSVEFTASQGASAQLNSLYAIILNGSTAESSTEILVLKLSEMLPEDDSSGLPGYLAVHLRDAGLVFGTDTATGFASKASGTVPETFEAWIATQLAGGAEPADLLAEADPDQDGVSNLVEYALGSEAGDGSSIAGIEIHEEEGQYFARYLRRVGDSSLQIQCETQGRLDEEAWPTLETSMTVLTDPPAPAGYERVQQLLPGTNGVFARLRVTRTGE